MSNWDWFQSRYLFRRRAMAPYPQPMGGSHNEPYEQDPEKPYGVARRPYTVNGPFNYGVFSPKTPYSFPDYYEDDHLESMSGYSGFGGVDVPGVGTVTCDPGHFVDKFIGKLPTLAWSNPLRIPFEAVKGALASEMKRGLSGIFNQMLSAVASGEGAFRTWFMVNVAYNVERASGIPQAVIGQLVPTLFGPIYATLNECKQSVSPFVGAGGAVVGKEPVPMVQAQLHLEHLASPVPKDFKMTFVNKIPYVEQAHQQTTQKSSVLPIAAAAVAAMLLLK